MLEKTVVTTEVEEVCTLGSAITDVTVSSIVCVLSGTTKAADNNETGVVEKASVVTAAAAARLGSAIVLETSVGAELVIGLVIGVIVTLNAGCANKLETCNVVFE